jgi:hypothetical protein
MWGFAATLVITLLPLIEGWPSLVLFVKFVMGKGVGKKAPSIEGIESASPSSGQSHVGYEEKMMQENIQS